MEIPGYVTVSEAARRLGCWPGSIRKMIQEGRVPGVEEFAGRRLVPVAWLETYRPARPGRPRKVSDRGGQG